MEPRNPESLNRNSRKLLKRIFLSHQLNLNTFNKLYPKESGTQKVEPHMNEWQVCSLDKTVSSLLLERHDGRCSLTLGLTAQFV